jgi:hypothetical protein
MKLIALTVFLCSVGLGYYVDDPVIGTWNLNVARSHYDPGPPPKSETRVYRPDKGDIRTSITTVYANGNSQTVVYPARFDGKEQPVSGSPDTDGIVMTRIDDSTSESTLTHAGKLVGKTRRVVERDGKTLTIKFKGVAENGDPVNNVAVYERVPQ